MGKTLYFCKVNIGMILELIKDDKGKETIMNKLFYAIENNIEAEKIIHKKRNGEPIIDTHKFTFTNINKFDNDSSKGLVGTIIKSHHVFIKQIDRKSGERKVYPVGNDEIIKFYFSPNDEIIVFYTSNKFGYKQICEALQMLLNRCFELVQGGSREFFTVSILNNGMSIEKIKSDLNKLGPIEELNIHIVPPNPINDEIKDLIKRDPEKQIKLYQDGRITEYVSTFKSSYVGGLNTKSQEIEGELDRAVGIHSKISDKVLLNNGYVKIHASGKNGIQYNSDERQAVKVKMNDTEGIGDMNFADVCKKYIKSLFKR